MGGGRINKSILRMIIFLRMWVLCMGGGGGGVGVVGFNLD